jgi:hypothetical protein
MCGFRNRCLVVCTTLPLNVRATSQSQASTVLRSANHLCLAAMYALELVVDATRKTQAASRL